MGRKKQRARFEPKASEDFRVGDQARRLIQNMVKAGSPVVSRGGVLSRVVANETGFYAQPVSKDALAAEFDDTTDYIVQTRLTEYDPETGEVKKDGKGRALTRLAPDIVPVPRKVLDIAYGLANRGDGADGLLWPLRGTLTHPIVNKEGEIVIRNGLFWEEEDRKGVRVQTPRINLVDGYDPASQYFFAISDHVATMIGEMKDLAPGVEEVKGAVEYIEWHFTDFDFATRSAFASLCAGGLNLICRDIVSDRVPGMLVQAPTVQSGKTILVGSIIQGVTGEAPDLFVPKFRDESEFTKQLFSKLLRGRNYIFMDNVTGKIQSAFLDAVMTSPSQHITDRLMGGNQEASLYCGMPFFITANQASLSQDMRNRLFLLDINKPADDKKYEHPNWKEHAEKDGPKLLKALFTLYLNWRLNYKEAKFTGRKISGFPEWSEKIGGILAAAGIEDFLVDTLTQIGEVEVKEQVGAILAAAWYEGWTDDAGNEHPGRGSAYQQVKDVLDLAVYVEYCKSADSMYSKLSTMGNRLKSLRMITLSNGYRFEKESREKDPRWRVVKI